MDRAFYMGMTPWPADFTPQGLGDAYGFINALCDIVSHHFDEGIPYEEAYRGLPMPAKLQGNIQYRQNSTATGKTILLSVAPLDISRHHKAGYTTDTDTHNDSIEAHWTQLPANDPAVITAYVNFISYLVDALHPAFVNYGVESNAAPGWDPAEFLQYKDFLAQVYPRLKAKYPSIPFFLSLIVSELPEATDKARQLLDYTDLIGLSAYPYTNASSTAGGSTDPALLPAEYFTRFIDLAPGKRWGFAETGYIARDLVIPSYQLNKQGTEGWQRDYFEKICRLSNERKGSFIIWFCHQDYDAAAAKLRAAGLYSDLFGIWEHIGLTDSAGHQRPAYQSWLDWMNKKRG